MNELALREVQDLLQRCEDELESGADGATLRSRFRHLLTPAIVSIVGSGALECEAFVLGACDAAEEAKWDWPAEVLLQIGQLAAHLGHTEQAARIAVRCSTEMPGNTEAIVLWAETAGSGRETVQRYLQALVRADDPTAVKAAAWHYALHSPEATQLRRDLETGLTEVDLPDRD